MIIEKAHFYRLKAAVGDLVTIVGGIERAAELTGYSKSTVHRWTSLEYSDMMPLPAVIVLELDRKNPIVTRAQCALHGLNTEPVALGESHVMGAYVQLSRATAELNAEMAEASADGVITGTEQTRIDDKASSVDEATERLRGGLAAAGGAAFRVVG